MRIGTRRSGLSFSRKRRKIDKGTIKNVILWIAEVFAVALIAFVLVYCFGMRTTVSGNSMSGTLENEDTVLINRIAYLLSDPEAGDVVVFYPNGNEKSHYYVKRVVAVPGDTVQITDGVLYVNGEAYDQEDTEVIEYAGVAEDEVTLGDDEYFVLGDNRNSSEDSRYANIGNVSAEDIQGKVWFCIRPFSSLGRVQ